MGQDQSTTQPSFCRQCGSPVDESKPLCPRCGKKWYMDKIEDQGSSLWQKIIEKRAAAGLADEVPQEPQRQYHCPNCMALLKTPATICPHCNESTVQAKIVRPDLKDSIDEEATAKALNLPAAAKGLSKIKGASRRTANLRRNRHPRWLNIVIIIAIVVILLIMAVTAALYFGWTQFNPLKPAEQPVETTTPLSLGEPAVTTRTNSATISWSSSLPARGKVLYGKNDNYGMSIEDNNKSITHEIILSEIDPSTAYHYAVLAIDETGHELVRSSDYTFEIETKPVKKLPVVTQFEVISGDTLAVVQWTTDIPATSQVLYGTTADCSNFTPTSPDYVTRHIVKLSNLNANTLYYYRIKSADSEGNETIMEPANVFTTLLAIPVGPKIGNKAPDFSLSIFQSLDSISFRNYAGKKVLLTFWAVYCPECDRELNLLQSLKDKNPDVVVLAIFLESRVSDIEKTISQYKAERGDLTVPVLVDPYKTTAHMYNVEKVPCTIYIDSDGIIRDIEYGSFNLDQIERTLNSY